MARRGIRARIAVAIGTVVFLVLAGTGVAAASWFASASSTGTVSAATVSLTVAQASGSGTLATQYKFSGAAPSAGVLRSVVLTNTGQAPLNYTFSVATTGSSTLAANISLTLWVMSGSCTTTPGTGSTAGTLASPPAMPTGATSAAVGAAAITLCLMTKLTTTTAASQGLSVTATPTVTGTVGSSGWAASASDSAFTQSVFQVGDVTSATCTTVAASLSNLTNGYVTLTWAAVASPPAGSTITYKIVDTTAGTAIFNPTTSPKNIVYGNLSASPDTVTIYAMDSLYGTTSPGVPFVLTRASGLFGLLLTSVTCPS